MNARICRGYLGVFGPLIDDIAREYIATLKELYGSPEQQPLKLKGGEYHITIASKPELQELRATGVISSDDLKTSLSLDVLNEDLQRSNQQGVYWVTGVWAIGQRFRSQLGLPTKQFHITLTSIDKHGIDKVSASYLILIDHDEQSNISDSGLIPNQTEYLTSFAYGLLAQNELVLAQSAAELLVTGAPSAPRGFVCLGDASVQRKLWKLAMLCFGRALSHHLGDSLDAISKPDKIATYCLKQLRRCSEHTEWGPIFVITALSPNGTSSELDELPANPVLRAYLCEPWSPTLRQYLRSVYQDAEPSRRPSRRAEDAGPPDSPVSSHHPQVVARPTTTQFVLPRFFRWIVPFYMALMSTPRNAEDIAALASPHVGVRHIITLTEETPLPSLWFEQPSAVSIRHTHIPVPNYKPPSLEQMDIILRRIYEAGGSPVLIHCGGGKGRAGTVAACYLAAFGFAPIPNQELSSEASPAMSAGEAIAAIRSMRPGSLETSQQEDFVKEWVSTLWKRRKLLLPRMVEPPPSPLVANGAVIPEVDLLLLCGLPGSGKSWFSQAIVRRGGIMNEGSRNASPIWRIISQDESGSRATCEGDIGRAGLPGSRAILDRCNPTSDERRDWIKLALWAQHPVCVWFDYDPQLCIDRAQDRKDHPTLRAGPRVRTAVASMRRSFQPPSNWQSEGFKGLARVTSFEAAVELSQLVCPVALLKFPRTPHLLNLGAVASDDIVAEASVPASIHAGEKVVITEKVDGANLGFSLSPSRGLLVQNRSHYIHSGEHPQFKALDSWVSDHQEGLYTVLDRDDSFLERYVLYGEWMAATHSIPYSALDDLFYAFDLYDRAANTFVSRSVLEQLLVDTNIKLTPLLKVCHEIPTNSSLVEMVQQKSRFYPGPVEGIYLKVENQHAVRKRGKVVRSDFIAGNEHWTKGAIHWNTVLQSLY
ncbi:ATP dependent DNA ligase [Ceratobasidium sp. AG-I]|nr:ATP dependent DNA ligase [Ceratobasidium sp. AG-I]